MTRLSVLIAVLLVFNLSVTPDLLAQQQANHVVSLDQLRTRLADRSAERDQHVAEVQKMLSHDEVRSRLGSLADLDKIQARIPALDDVTLAQLAEESRTINDQFQAGIGNVGWIAIIVVAIAVIIIVNKTA